MTAPPASRNPVGVSEGSPGRKPWETDAPRFPLRKPIPPPAAGRGRNGLREKGVLPARPQGSRPGLPSPAPSGANSRRQDGGPFNPCNPLIPYFFGKSQQFRAPLFPRHPPR